MEPIISFKDVEFIDSLVNLTGVIIECLDFTIPGLFAMATTAAGKSPTASPSKWNKRLQKPMGNFTSLVHMIVKLLSACEKRRDCQESPQTLGVLAAVLTSLIDKLSYFFVHINGATAITSILKTLTPALRIYLENAHASAKIAQATLDKRLFTTRLIQKIEKLWVDLLTCVQTRHGGPYNSDFLTVMSPLLEVTFCHPKRSIKNHTVMFWNATFANSQNLDYPEGLRPILQIAKDKMSLTLPGWENIKVSAKESQLETESEDLTQQVEIIKPFPYGILTSPQRNKPPSFPGGSPQMKGSFLHRGVIADKATENSSPKLFGRSPKPIRPRNSPSGTHVRRKLPLSKYDDDDQDYVMIAPSPKKKRLLTEHQKEMMCSRSNVPALYNELDRSQDCSHFSQYTLASQAQVTADSTPSSSPDEESGLPEGQKKSEGESDPTKMDGCEIDIVLDKNEVDISDARELEISEPGAGGVGELKVAEEIGTMEIEGKKCNSVLCERTVRSSNIESLGKGDDEVVEDTTKTSNESQIGEEEDEVTSPDVIPSSQTSSFDSPFQSLRRVSIPLSSALPDSFDSLTKLRSVENLELDKPKLEAAKSDDSVVETQRSEEHNEKEKDSVDKVAVSKTIVSPIAGRTRRKLQQKTEVNKTPSLTEPESEPTEQEVSQLTSESSKIETEQIEKSPEKVTEPKIAEISRDATSSPVPSMMNKFLRPLSAGGSPCRVTFSGNCSPGVSPTNGILKKKWPGNKPSEDSPSPPSKVRRVSFALPVKDDSCDDREKMTLTRSNASQVKKPNSSPFTAVKQRRPLPGISDQSSCQSLECVFPELVSCKVPVDQILPSILAMSWSRGMGHLVRAQNIHTIGNLSALKEDQVNNLPIKSPKVLTLKKALRRFQETHRGKNAKPLRSACLKDAFREEDEYKEDFISSDLAQLQDELTDKDSDKETLDCKTVFVSRNEKPEQVKTDDHWQSSEPEVVDGDVAPKGMLGESYIEVGLQNKSTAVSANSDHLGDDDLDSVEDVLCEPYVDVDLESKYTTGLGNSEKVKGESIDESVGSEEEEPLTPPLQGHDDIGANESSNGLTPRRETCSLPTRLFTSANATPSGLETEDILFHDRNTENVEENQIKEFCKEESTIKLEGSALPVGSTAEETAVLPLAVETDIAVDQRITTEKEKFRDCLRSLKELTSAGLLREFSAEEIFETHQNLTEVMAIIVQSLKGRCQ